MAKVLHVGVSSVARKTKKLYIGIDGKARKVKRAYVGISNKARLFYSSGYSSANAGIYVFVGYDNKCIRKLDPNSLSIVSNVSVYADASTPLGGTTQNRISAGGCAGMLVLSTQKTGSASSSDFARDARVIDTSTGATLSKIDTYDTSKVSGWEFYSGGTPNILISASPYGGSTTARYQDIRKRNPETYALITLIQTTILSYYANVPAVFTKGGTDSELYYPYLTKYTDDGDSTYTDNVAVLDINTMAVKRQTKLQYNSSFSDETLSADCLNGKMYYLTSRYKTTYGYIYIIDPATLTVSTRIDKHGPEIYWECALATVK